MTHADLTLRILASLGSLGSLGAYYAIMQKVRLQASRIEDLNCRITGQRLDDVIRGGR